jgi:hypothetical protein
MVAKMTQISISDLYDQLEFSLKKDSLINCASDAQLILGGSGTVSFAYKDYGLIIDPVEFGATDDPIVYDLPRKTRK